MNARQQEILHILLTQSDQHLLVQDIAEKVDCSEKTIRNDFKAIEEYIKQHSNASLIRKPGLGVYLEIEERDKTALFKQLHLANNPVYESNERVLQIAYQLLMSVKPVTVQDFALQYFVNKAIIKKDLDKIDEWLKDMDLTLISKQRVGLTIIGAEKNKRTAFSRFYQLTNNMTSSNQFIKEQFSSYEAEAVKIELKELQNRHSLYFTDETVESLIIHTLLMIKRIKLKQPVSISENEKSLLRDKKEYEWTSEFLKRLEPVFSLHFPEEEITYLALHILGGKIRYQQRNETDKLAGFTENNPMLLMLVHLLVNRMTELNMIEFTKDQTLLSGLKVHLYTTLNRLNYGLSVTNPMLDDIKKMYPYMFDMVINVLEEINQSFALSIPEEEAAYVTLHFQASIERLKSTREKKKNAVIVCHMGIGTSQLLKTKIERKFYSIHIMGCIAKADLKEFVSKYDVDLVISTVSLPELKIPHLVVSPLLTAAEEEKLMSFINQFEESVHHKIEESVLLKYTNPFLVFLQQDAEHRYEIIEMLADSLYEKGYVEKEYAHNAINREKMSSTTIGAGIAIPHGSPKLIKQSAIAIATLKKPIKWGSEKVTLVFMLAVKNDEHEETKQLFSELSYLTEQPAFIQTLIKEEDKMNFLSNFHVRR
ncbi:BglG family transcription antiterminator [Metabacillus hrfriensis]|uniref:BglG family transcription antiterminator n=1 Tax=Metabacillus hrfriensis TaxID=3048891 RepID=A0ACD4RG53_9BACI|nr:BglG family transcription antiterminator [Metabacillus sp. CT-WN-B3]WHZ59303.1 BglG family transcription antiterminator [Metabacillus sp. CT-WN-B3]